jgi:hypothetical protein
MYVMLRHNMTHMQILFAILKDELVKYAKEASQTFWEYDAGSGLVELPGSVTGQLGGPSQRRLPPALASAILQGVCFTGWTTYTFLNYQIKIKMGFYQCWAGIYPLLNIPAGYWWFWIIS